MNQLIKICSWIKWFIIGGNKPESNNKIESLEEVDENEVSPQQIKQTMRSATSNGDSQLDWRKKNTILEWAARYEIENDEHLYKSLQKMRKMGGTLAMKTFHEHVRSRVSTYNQIIQTEIDHRVENKIKINMIYVLITNILVLSLPYL